MLSELESSLRNINPYAKACKLMYEVERKELERCVKIGSMPREVTMIIKRNDKLDKNIYNEASCNEVAMIFVGKDGQPSIEKDMVIYFLFYLLYFWSRPPIRVLATFTSDLTFTVVTVLDTVLHGMILQNVQYNIC